jgi:hypothetical protein
MHDSSINNSAPPISMARFLDVTGTSPVTAWRWERKGWLKTVRIAGRKYITETDLREFNQRLVAGEFAGQTQKPRPKSTPSKPSDRG